MPHGLPSRNIVCWQLANLVTSEAYTLPVGRALESACPKPSSLPIKARVCREPRRLPVLSPDSPGLGLSRLCTIPALKDSNTRAGLYWDCCFGMRPHAGVRRKVSTSTHGSRQHARDQAPTKTFHCQGGHSCLLFRTVLLGAASIDPGLCVLALRQVGRAARNRPRPGVEAPHTSANGDVLPRVRRLADCTGMMLGTHNIGIRISHTAGAVRCHHRPWRLHQARDVGCQCRRVQRPTRWLLLRISFMYPLHTIYSVLKICMQKHSRVDNRWAAWVVHCNKDSGTHVCTRPEAVDLTTLLLWG